MSEMRKYAGRLAVLISLAILCAGYVFYQPDLPLEYLIDKYADGESRFIDINGLRVHYRDQGEGRAVILLHGTGASLHTWDGWVRELAGRYRVIRMDLPAFGLTGPTEEGDYSMAFYTAFLKDFLDKTGVESCVLAGNSLGGRIAWNFSWMHPDRVDKLILIDPAGMPRKTPTPFVLKIAGNPLLKHILKHAALRGLVEKSLREVYGDPEKVTPELIDRYYELSLRPGAREAFGRRAALLYRDNTDKLSEIKIPVLILWGEKDAWIPVEDAELFKNRLVDAEVIVYPGLGHVPMEEAPEQTVRDALLFMKK